MRHRKSLGTRRDFLRNSGLVTLGLGMSHSLLVNSTAHGAGMKIATQTMVAARVPTGKLEHGIGFNWFDATSYKRPDEDSQGNPTYPELNDRAGWAGVTQALDDLRPGIIRYWLAPDACVGEKAGHIKTDNVGFERLQRVADWAQENGCTVLLELMKIPKKYQFEMGPQEREQIKSNQWLDMAAKRQPCLCGRVRCSGSEARAG